jgi:hypothetical protein
MDAVFIFWYWGKREFMGKGNWMKGIICETCFGRWTFFLSWVVDNANFT